LARCPVWIRPAGGVFINICKSRFLLTLSKSNQPENGLTGHGPTLKGHVGLRKNMESIFYTFQEFITYTQSVVYLLAAGALVVLVLFWRFLTGRDEKKRTF